VQPLCASYIEPFTLVRLPTVFYLICLAVRTEPRIPTSKSFELNAKPCITLARIQCIFHNYALLILVSNEKWSALCKKMALNSTRTVRAFVIITPNRLQIFISVLCFIGRFPNWMLNSTNIFFACRQRFQFREFEAFIKKGSMQAWVIFSSARFVRTGRIDF